MPSLHGGLGEGCPLFQSRSRTFREAFQHFGESVEREDWQKTYISGASSEDSVRTKLPRSSLPCLLEQRWVEDLEPFVQPMMEKLGSKLQGNVKRQKKAGGNSKTRPTHTSAGSFFLHTGDYVHCSHCWTGLVHCASRLCFKWSYCMHLAAPLQVDDAFAPYYGHLMPLLEQAPKSYHRCGCSTKLPLPGTQGMVAVVLPNEQKHVSLIIRASQLPGILAGD